MSHKKPLTRCDNCHVPMHPTDLHTVINQEKILLCIIPWDDEDAKPFRAFVRCESKGFYFVDSIAFAKVSFEEVPSKDAA